MSEGYRPGIDGPIRAVPLDLDILGEKISTSQHITETVDKLVGKGDKKDDAKQTMLKLSIDPFDPDNPGVLIDGQARAIAMGLTEPLKPTPLLKCPITGEMSETKDILARIFKMQELGQKLHPYEEMTSDAVKRFPHCAEEILAFFEHEKKVNLQIAAGTAVNHAGTRSIQWAQFWSGISQLNTERHNEQVQQKKDAKNERRGKGGKRVDCFNGPTYGYSRKST